MSTATAEKLWNRSFLLCVATNLFLFIYYYALLTILPIYIMKALGGSVSQAGLALTLFLVSSIAIRPFSGLIIEKVGKKKAFLASSAMFMLLALGYLFVDSMLALLVIRFVHGIWFSVLTTVTVPIANEFIPEQRKGEGMGYYVMSTNLAVVFGPLIALTVVQYSNFTTLFAVLTGIIALSFIFCLMIPVKEHVQSVILSQDEVRPKFSWHHIIETRAVPIGFVALVTSFAYSSIMSFITAYSESKHLLAYTSLFFIVFAISMIVVRPWIGKIYDRKGPSAVIYPSFLFFALGLFTVSMMSNQWILWLSAVFIGIGYGSLFPCFQTLAIQAVPKERMGHAISTFFTLFDLGMAVGSVVLGLVIARFGFESTYALCAVLVLLTVLLYKATVASRLAKKA